MHRFCTKRLFFLICSVSFSYNVFAEKPVLELGRISHLYEQSVGEIVIERVYAELNIDIDVIHKPAKRLASSLRAGIVDGEVMRIYQYGVNNPSVVRVPTPYYVVSTAAFSHSNSGIELDSPEQLNDYSIVKIRGIVVTDILSQNAIKTADINSTSTMMRLLDDGFADIGLTHRLNGELALQFEPSLNIQVHNLIIDERELYHYLHIRHANMVSQVDAVIRRFRDSGELEEIIAAAEQAVVEQLELTKSYVD
ncbi:transporter substrate-binding domain-containing protein [Alteromonas sp. ASW11-36]|uniref:Transporter substrate-binding domain-containing protein n=1 Tax=Alteromonas arenosi TaxID=3055817 RepID=A0ABT7SZ76_9ALTE|nr:transporter substrate-binding domain-containing protein [Alteromonas sp. ASW11-36]MDM7860852.1 transporter substrate-binding domain-containing protein [Alteromonas sp. ASW11-36]